MGAVFSLVLNSVGFFHMAIRIDLLPRYVALRRYFKRTLAGCLLLVAICAAGLSAFYYHDYLQLQTLQVNVENVKPVAADAEATQQSADAFVSQAQPLQTTVDFFVDAARTGAERAAILDLIRRYIYNGAVIGSMDISDGTSAKLTATVRTPDDYARFLLNLRRGATPTGILFSSPAEAAGIKGGTGGTSGAPTPAPGPVPGAPPIAPVVAPVDTAQYEVLPNSITASATLKDPVTVPSPPGEAAAAAPAAPAAGAPVPPVTTPPKP